MVPESGRADGRGGREGPLDPPRTRARSELTDRPAGRVLGPRSLGPPSLYRSLARSPAQQEEARRVGNEAALRATVAASLLLLSPPHRLFRPGPALKSPLKGRRQPPLSPVGVSAPGAPAGSRAKLETPLEGPRRGRESPLPLGRARLASHHLPIPSNEVQRHLAVSLETGTTHLQCFFLEQTGVLD